MNLSEYNRDLSAVAEQELLLIGTHRTTDVEAALTAVDIIVARPERWCLSWAGRFVTRIRIDDQFGSFGEWAARRNVNCEHLEAQQTLSAEKFWGAIILSSDNLSIERARDCLDAGIPCIAVDTESMDMFLLSHKNLASWGQAHEDSQDKNEITQILAAEGGLTTIHVTESPFSNNSAMMHSAKMYEPVMASRDGDRCTLTPSQAGKAG